MYIRKNIYMEIRYINLKSRTTLQIVNEKSRYENIETAIITDNAIH